MVLRENLKKFLFPKFDAHFAMRAIVVAAVSFIIFYFFLTPIRLRGKSMEPTLKDGSIHFLCKICFMFKEPKRGDIVGIKLAGRKVILLKRVVGVEGEKVEFREGKLFIEGKEVYEPYIKGESDWNYEGKVVEKGKLFVVGDNRSVPIESHDFGEVSKKRIVGKMIW